MKVAIYDRTALFDNVKNSNDILTYSWMYGSRMFKLFNSLDTAKGVSSWEEAFSFLEEFSKTTVITGVQFWGHGAPGVAAIGGELLNRKKTSQYKERLSNIGSRMSEDAYWWWRTCGTYGRETGKHFAEHFTKTLGRKTAGHTHVIGFWQSGGHVIRPEQKAHWSDVEGFAGDQMISSNWNRPNTIICAQTKIPKNWEMV
jgi:hypothetical protein